MTRGREKDDPSGGRHKSELEELRARLGDAEEALRAIRTGEADAIVVARGSGEQVYSLKGTDWAYRQLVETMNEGAAILSATGIILYGNSRLVEMLARPLDRVLGTAMRDYLPPAERKELDAILARARMEPFRQEMNLTTEGGGAVPVYLSASRLHSEGEELVFGVVLMNLTEQKSYVKIAAAEAELRKSMEEFRTLAEAMPQIVWITGPDGKNIFFNNQWMDYTGMTAEESRGDGWNKPFHPDERLAAWETWQKATRVRGIYSLECRLRRADGAYRWWLVRGVPLIDAEGNISKWYGTCTDIHDLKTVAEERISLQNQLAQSQKIESVGRLAGGVAHDFNNILTAISGYTGFALAGLPEGDQRRADLKEVLVASERAARLTRQLLAFSRKQILNPEILDVNAAVDGIMSMLRRLIGEDIKLVSRLSSQPCLAKVDAGQIEQVFLNLAVNARDAMPKGGTLDFETAITAAAEPFLSRHPEISPGSLLICLTVRDTGCGMTDEVRSHLFEPFFTTKEMGKGTGLGLSMVYGIVKQSGGDIEVESVPDGGTTFRIYLPQVQVGTEIDDKVKDGAKGKNRPVGGRETVLFVEDEVIVRRLGERILIGNGYTVLTAGSGTVALSLLEERAKPVDLLITDVVMPGMSGRELARTVAEMGLSRRTLFVSGYTDDAIVQHGILEPGLALLNKPFSPDALLLKIREVLDGPADKAKA